ncbi:3-hydroxyisobutyrate dehydrogenase, mitochondrial [Myotis brandtii]|uniref:3-hydroxyisobutyrate dehydrogenase, mitochondrial n=1 Tax=Myotis brandtii TaxID=109478 RepID=S7NBK8_MYOBR|nr:3-hydroxyisobutyrate dehydrogenase, mitochondrial [Myotis brandtii]
MVGGVEEEFAAAKELLGCVGSNVVYCGAAGTGQAAKICNNMLLAISMIGTAEAMNLGISQAHQIYRMMCAKGYSKKDFSSVFQFLREEETF